MIRCLFLCLLAIYFGSDQYSGGTNDLSNKKGGPLTNMKDNVVVEEPKEAEKPSLVLTIGNGTYPVILHFSTRSSISLEDRIKQLIRQEVFSGPA